MVFVNFLARDKGRSWQKENGRKSQERNTERKAKKFGWSWRFPTNSRWKNNPSLPYARSRYKLSRLCSSPTVPLGDSIEKRANLSHNDLRKIMNYQAWRRVSLEKWHLRRLWAYETCFPWFSPEILLLSRPRLRKSATLRSTRILSITLLINVPKMSCYDLKSTSFLLGMFGNVKIFLTAVSYRQSKLTTFPTFNSFTLVFFFGISQLWKQSLEILTFSLIVTVKKQFTLFKSYYILHYYIYSLHFALKSSYILRWILYYILRRCYYILR